MLSTEINDLLVKIFIVALTMVAMGLVMVSSSSMALSDHGYGSMNYHTYAHLARICLGIFLAYIVSNIGIKTLRRFSPSLMMAGLVLSVLVFVPGLSVDVNGASRWLRLGPVVFQPYDLFKLGYILFFAYALDRFYVKRELDGLQLSAAVLVVISFMLLSQPDFGSFSLLVSTTLLIIVLVSGVTKKLIVAGMALAACLVWLVVSEPYRMKRIATLFDPWSDRYGSGFQLIQAMVAEGSGGIVGIGLGKSIQKMLYLPEAHTDFTISVFAEEVGMVGVLIAILLSMYLFVLLMRLSSRLRHHEYLFESYVVFLVANFIFIQFLFNIGVNYGLLPTKGITLPFMGYGGTSVVSHIIMIGMVMSLRKMPLKDVSQSFRRPNVKGAGLIPVV
ncbi:MAG: putative lipid II flippase FtsW [Gammaproteobacteria bacterium]|nr:putative lipid II flippase FtsW [Gammaproteobacteria bacterium]